MLNLASSGKSSSNEACPKSFFFEKIFLIEDWRRAGVSNSELRSFRAAIGISIGQILCAESPFFP